jgi:hypothetical protein
MSLFLHKSSWKNIYLSSCVPTSWNGRLHFLIKYCRNGTNHLESQKYQYMVLLEEGNFCGSKRVKALRNRRQRTEGLLEKLADYLKAYMLTHGTNKMYEPIQFIRDFLIDSPDEETVIQSNDNGPKGLIKDRIIGTEVTGMVSNYSGR